MTTINRAVVEQALIILDSEFTSVDGEFCRWCDGRLLSAKHNCSLEQTITALRAALAQEQAEPTVKDSLQVPAEVAAALTTTDIAWLETRRLTRLWQELGQMRWAGADEGWDRAIEAVRSRLNDECQDALDWKAAVDRSNMTAIELLQKMQRLKDE